MILSIWIAFVVVLSCAANKIHDAKRGDPWWEKNIKLPSWMPIYLQRKISNPWHIAKQLMFLPPLGTLIVVQIMIGHLALAILTLVCGWATWERIIPDPPHWD